MLHLSTPIERKGGERWERYIIIPLDSLYDSLVAASAALARHEMAWGVERTHKLCFLAGGYRNKYSQHY
jgi:hypothetical protein